MWQVWKVWQVWQVWEQVEKQTGDPRRCCCWSPCLPVTNSVDVLSSQYILGRWQWLWVECPGSKGGRLLLASSKSGAAPLAPGRGTTVVFIHQPRHRLYGRQTIPLCVPTILRFCLFEARSREYTSGATAEVVLDNALVERWWCCASIKG